MPNIFKHFLRSAVNEYKFPDVEELDVGEDLVLPESDHGEEGATAPEADDDGATGSDPGQGAAAMFSYARVQAEEIVAQAKRQGEELLEEYRQQAQQQAQQILEDAKQDGYRQGYADGLVKAQAESRAQMEQLQQQQMDQVKAYLDQATQAKDEMLEKVQDELCDLSIAVASKVIHISLKSSREVILRMVQMATERLKRREWVRIYIGGCDSRELAQIAPELTASLAGLSDHIKLIPMADDESGTCIIEMPDQIIDASASTQLDNLKGILRGG